jgi:hypothetical protein
MRNWEFNILTLDGIQGSSFEVLPDNTEPPLEMRRPITTDGRKVPLKDVMEGKVPMCGDHRLYERRSVSWTSKTATYVEVRPGETRQVCSESHRKNNSCHTAAKMLRRNSQKT